MRQGWFRIVFSLMIFALASPAAKSDRSTNGSDREAGQSGSKAAQEMAATARSPEVKRIVWQDWSEDIFSKAKRENRYVLLDLEAVWCHWCHVMDEKTYRDPSMIKLVNARFIPVKVDQDSRPDLSNRYDDYGWPATVVFDPSGKEKAIWSGYFPPQEMIAMLRSSLQDKSTNQLIKPKNIPVSKSPALSEKLREELKKTFDEGYDTESGGWGFGHKFLNADSVEYAMYCARAGDKVLTTRARETLEKQLQLIDPVWGGVYQYSTDDDWVHPHFEKIMQMQAENLGIYAQAYEQWHAPEYLKAAKDIERYLSSFLLNPEGAFYTSQDADLIPGKQGGEYFTLSDGERRKRGTPRVDKHIYARENGWAINALTTLYMATADESYLKTAEKAAEWIIANRSIAGGGFSHDASDSAGPYLGDTLAMGRAFLSLYIATTDPKWLDRAKEAAIFINKHFWQGDDHRLNARFVTADLLRASSLPPEPLLEENIHVARWTNLLCRYTGVGQFRAMAQQAMRYLATPEIAHKPRVFVAGILLADKELAEDPPQVIVVGGKGDPAARALFLAALSYPGSYKRVEWWDPAQGSLPFMNEEYPMLKEAGAFTCVNGRCSSPIRKPDLLLTRMLAGKDETSR